MGAILKAGEHSTDFIISQAAKAIEEGKIVVFPTETCYGIGGNALDKKVINKIRKIKNRDQRPFTIIVSGLLEAEDFLEINETAKLLIWEFMPGPLTIIVKKRAFIPLELAGENVGFRISPNEIAHGICSQTGLPMISTSANLHGEKEIYSGQKATEIFGEKADLIIDTGELKNEKPSTVYDVEKGTVLREGKITLEQIQKVLGE